MVMDKKLYNYYRKNYETYANLTALRPLSGSYDLVSKYLKSGSRVFDAGTASGRDMLHFKGMGCETFGCDLVKEFVDRLKEAGVKNVYMMDFLDVPYEEFFDLIWMNDFISQFSFTEYEKVFSKAYDMLKKDGHIFICARSTNSKSVGPALSAFDDQSMLRNYISDKFKIVYEDSYMPDNFNENNIWFRYILKKR